MTYVVGHSPWHIDSGVLEFAGQLARAHPQRLHVVSVVPGSWPTPMARGADREYEQWSAAQGETALREARRILDRDGADLELETVSVAARSVPQALLDQADAVGALTIIVGSAQHGASGSITLGSKADRLLHSSPVPVAVVPRGYHPARGTRIARATCAFRGDEASRSTLARTAEFCRLTGCDLRVVTFGVRGRRMYPPEVTGAEQMVLEGWLEQNRADQQEALQDLDPELLPEHVESTTAVGGSWFEAMDAIDWHRQDVLVVGSSSTGRFTQIFLGSSAAKIVQHSPVPTIVVP